MLKYSNAGLIVKNNDASVSATLREVRAHLSGLGVNTLLDHSTVSFCDDCDTVDINTIGKSCDIAIVIGGDGTLLSASRALVDYGIPLVGINRGRLGFLVDVPPGGNFNELTEILQGNGIEESRFLLEATVLREGESVAQSLALNDVVVRVNGILQIMDFDVIIDDRLVTHQRADGVVMATPSGSTAYSLSNGGPIVGPSIDAVIMQPICPHTLTSRPLMVDANSILKIHLWDDAVKSVQVICDGQVYNEATLGDMVRVQRYPTRVMLLHPAAYDYHQILKEKLSWG